MAGRIRDRLALRFGEDQVFMDIDAIPIGVDFREHVGQAVARADAVLVVIGEEWMGLRADGTRRIMDERDPIRLEVEAAFTAKRRVIPLLIDGAEMPAETDLPASISSLAYINAAHVESGRDFNAHMERLVRALEGVVGKAAPPPAPVVSAPVPAGAASGYRWRAIIGIAVTLGILVALVAAAVEFSKTLDTTASTGGTSTPSKSAYDRIVAHCEADPVEGTLDCNCFANEMTRRLSSPQQAVFLVMLDTNADPAAVQKAMTANGISDPNFYAYVSNIVVQAVATCSSGGGAKN